MSVYQSTGFIYSAPNDSLSLIQVQFAWFLGFCFFFASIELVIYIFELNIIKNSNEQIQ